ncbi:patatin-like phospholipase family protein [Pseudenhygromyxa sp. WMMC2535]|uniref:patatin-like phospholipase family protein n=1 Tax=Pseudenhygromyxa sp. WMMC2535 TaxID=2712867 RepID=UPI00155305EC|nr:patatin-like phospholipase family protein [Pseudenhygromyxa sp. WMMC2535]NVB42831.1 patatin-like phospholipase family protein [Pseudenhygromyxa sp. WMMC2535]
MAAATGEGFSIVLAGGGIKTFWSMGVLRSIADLLPPVDHYAGVSGGAVMAVVQVSERVDASLDFFVAATRQNQRNFYPGALLRGGRPFPHEAMLRRTMDFVLEDGGFERIQAGPPIHILLSYIAAGRSPWRTGLSAFRTFERRSRAGWAHGPAKLPPGMGMQVVSSVTAGSREQLVDWTLMSSSTPLVTRPQFQGGRRYVDGALVDNVPVRALPNAARAGRVLALLTSPRKVARRPLRTVDGGLILYLHPAEELPASLWDYASPDRLLDLWAQGQREGRALRPRVEALLAAPLPGAPS